MSADCGDSEDVEYSIGVEYPPLLDGASCLVVDHFARFSAGGRTEVATWLHSAKSTAAPGGVRLDAAKELWQQVGGAARCIPPDHPARRATAIVHVPMSESNKYAINAVACAVSEALEIDIDSACLVKQRSTRKMKCASPREKASIAGALGARSLPAERVLVIDDIVESGATLAAAGQALRKAGAVEITYLAAASLGWHPCSMVADPEKPPPRTPARIIS